MTSLSINSQATLASTDASTPPAVRAEGLGRVIADRRVLSEIELDIPLGAFVGLLGANGAGKSTLMSVLAMLAPATEGRIELFGQTVTRNNTQLRRRIGMIGHRPMLYRDLTARENLVLFGKLYGLSDPLDRAAQMLEQVGLTDRADDAVGTFSRGMTQRVSIARALMHDPQLLLADEPFSGLDIASVAIVERLLRDLHAKQGRTIILAHHDLHHAFGLVDRLAVLRRGRLVLQVRTSEADIDAVRREVIGQ